MPKDFILGVKLNSADFVDKTAASQSDEPVLQHIRNIVSWGVFDFLEISGGDYESPGLQILPWRCRIVMTLTWFLLVQRLSHLSQNAKLSLRSFREKFMNASLKDQIPLSLR